MTIGKKKPNMLSIEDCIRNIQLNKSVESHLKAIERNLQREFGSIGKEDGVLFDVSITENTRGEFFGMNVYPSQEVMDRMIREMVVNKSKLEIVEQAWQKNDVWRIEIDSLLLHDINLKATPSEIVSVLLHELGHVAFSNSVPCRVNRVIRTFTLLHSIEIQKVLKSNRVYNKLLYFPIIEACSTKNFKRGQMKKELVADDFAYRCGYGVDLESFLDKLIINGNNKLINRPESEVEDDIKVFVQWTVENLSQLQFRKTKLKQKLNTELMRNPSKYTKQIVSSIKERMFGDDKKNTFESVVQEASLVSSVKKAIVDNPKALFNRMGQVKPVHSRDLDIYQAEMSRIDTVDDKIFLLENLYDDLDRVKYALKMIHDGKKDRVTQSEQTLQTVADEINKIISMVNALPIKPKQYGIYIKYPAGYEG